MGEELGRREKGGKVGAKERGQEEWKAENGPATIHGNGHVHTGIPKAKVGPPTAILYLTDLQADKLKLIMLYAKMH